MLLQCWFLPRLIKGLLAVLTAFGVFSLLKILLGLLLRRLAAINNRVE